MPIEVETSVDAPFEHVVDYEVESGKVRKIIAPAGCRTAVAKQFQNAFLRHLVCKDGIQVRIVWDETYIGTVAFISGTTMGDTMQAHLNQISHQFISLAT
jgi:hypothetical protein